MQTKSRQFSMVVLRKRAQKLMRSKFKKKMPLTKLDEVLRDYIEHGVIVPLLRTGKGQLDKYTEIEIVGKRPELDPKYFALLSKGKMISGGAIVGAKPIGRNRKDYIYKLVVKDSTYNGKIIFEADPKLKKRVRYVLETTQTYFRLLN